MSHLYLQHRTRALAIARRILGNLDEAEDVVQEVFSGLWLRPVKFEGRAALSTWLHRIMVNRSLNSLRSRQRRSGLELAPRRQADPEEEAINEQARRRFLAALPGLSEQHRQLLFYRDIRGLSYPEIATLLQLREGTVKSALHRGRRKLLEQLAKTNR